MNQEASVWLPKIRVIRVLFIRIRDYFDFVTLAFWFYCLGNYKNLTTETRRHRGGRRLKIQEKRQ